MERSARAPSEPFGLYVHIPYCVKKCPYCDFNSYALSGLRPAPANTSGARGRFREMEEGRYVEAVEAELAYHLSLPGWSGRRLGTIFIGGGTPSLFDPRSIARIIDAAASRTAVAPDIEITLEANPGTINEELHVEKLSGFRSAGVSRMSMGVQSFSAAKLAKLGRLHGADDVPRAVENMRAAGIENFNLDLMFGVAGETVDAWRDDLERAVALGPAHISAYGLSVEPGTDFARQSAHGAIVKADDDTQGDMYELAVDLLEEHGFERYEISSFAQPGRRCRHNLGYWRGTDYLGIGAGAHSYLRNNGSGHGTRWSNIPGPELYIDRALASGDPVQRRDEVTPERAEAEFLLLRLRTADGASFAEYRGLFSSSLEERYAPTIDDLVARGHLTRSEHGIALTRSGFLLVDHLLALFD